MTEEIKLGEEFDSAVFKDAPRLNLSRRAIVTGLAAGTVFPFITNCTTNPETGRSQIAFMGDEQIAGMATSAWSEMKTQTPQTSNTALKTRVLNVWDRIAKASGRGDQQWDVAVFDTDDVNAFVMPGNRVGVYRGITTLTENDDQLASILGHENGHVAGRHASERMSQIMLGQAVLMAGQIAVASNEEMAQYGNLVGALGGAALQFGVILPFSRKHELEADILGVDYMHRAGYDVKQSVRLWELMAASSEGKRPPELLSTHPDPIRRAEELKKYINAKGYALM